MELIYKINDKPAFARAASMSIGYVGILIGATLAGLVYVILSIVIKHVGIGWINKVMPPVVIGPTVAIIGLTLAPNAVNSLLRGSVLVDGVSVANKYNSIYYWNTSWLFSCHDTYYYW